MVGPEEGRKVYARGELTANKVKELAFCNQLSFQPRLTPQTSMIATDTDYQQSYTFRLEVYADSQQAVLACLTDLLARFQQKGMPVDADTITGPGYEAFTQTSILD